MQQRLNGETGTEADAPEDLLDVNDAHMPGTHLPVSQMPATQAPAR
jgi:hypothetical protein